MLLSPKLVFEVAFPRGTYMHLGGTKELARQKKSPWHRGFTTLLSPMVRANVFQHLLSQQRINQITCCLIILLRTACFPAFINCQAMTGVWRHITPISVSHQTWPSINCFEVVFNARWTWSSLARSPVDCKENVQRIIISVNENSTTALFIKAGFRKCGIHPFELNATDMSQLCMNPKSHSQHIDEQSTSHVTLDIEEITLLSVILLTPMTPNLQSQLRV